MTTESSVTPDSPGAVAIAPPVSSGKFAAYCRLAKLDIFDYYLSLAVAWSLLAAPLRTDSTALAVLALFGLGMLCLVAAMTTFDDVTGLRDGSDAANYGPDAPLRKIRRKPLLAGTLTEREAIRFGWATAAGCVLLWGAAVAVAPHAPWWAVATAALCLVTSVQYSYGLKISYHGWQEIFMVALGLGLVVAPYGLLAGQVSGFALVQGTLFGLGPLLFGVYSNTNDRAGDAAVGRPTVAVLTTERGNKVFIGAVSAVESVLIAAATVTGMAPWWFPLAMLPVVALRVAQFVTGVVRGRILTARKLGTYTHRVSVVALVVTNVLLTAAAGGGA